MRVNGDPDPATLESLSVQESAASRRLTLTLLLHPDPGRVGARASLTDLGDGLPIGLSRTYPDFRDPVGREARPLEHQRVSRQPLWLTLEGESLIVQGSSAQQRIFVDHQRISEAVEIPWRRVEDGGILIQIGSAILLWLSAEPTGPWSVDGDGMIGVSPAMVRLRQRVRSVASTPFPVLIRGESGVGKELVARSIHALGRRPQGPWIALNMAALPPSVAAAELFGYGRGAFTGASHSSAGRFEEADGGTLFLDEIGEAPIEVQAQLLRALETGEIQPLGKAARVVDVRIVAATDADLEERIQSGSFRHALYQRLRSTTIEVPPLRARPQDIPLLLLHFLQGALERCGAPEVLRPAALDQDPWLGADLVSRLMRHPFPGNVRELKHVATEIVVESRHRPRARLSGEARSLLQLTPAAPPAAPSPTHRPPPAPWGLRDLTQAQIRGALAQHEYNVTQAAKALGVAKNTLMKAIREDPQLRLPGDLPAEEIEGALLRHGGDVGLAAQELQVSPQGLRLRLRELGL